MDITVSTFYQQIYLQDYLKDERNLETSKIDSLLKHNADGIKRKMNMLANQIKTLEEFIKENME